MNYWQHLLLLSALFFSVNVQASFPEFFGASARSMSLGGQFTADSADAVNNYYAPALLAFSPDVDLSYSANLVEPHLLDLGTLTTKNTATHTATSTGKVSSDYGRTYLNSFHLSVPLARPKDLKLALSYFSPMNYLVESSTGDTFLPEYVMYHTRFRRVQVFINGAYPLNSYWALSAGAHLGLQVRADTYTVADTGGNNGSQARAQAKAAPSIAGLFSVARKFENATAFFAFQQYMKQKLKALVIGETTQPTALVFNNDMNTMMSFDPMIFRLGGSAHTTYATLLGQVEYQFWNMYETSVIRINQAGGVIRPSANYEKVVKRNIIVPKLGVEFTPVERVTFRLGGMYRPSPLKGDFSGSGNSIDTNSWIAAGGAGYKMQVWKHLVEFDSAFQYHRLEKKAVVKSANMENGQAGNKIGAPGYTIGGSIYSASFGMRLHF